MSNLPKDCEPVVVDIKKVYRFKHYKPNSQQAKKGTIGRWQEFNGYGWDNCADPRGPTGPLPEGGRYAAIESALKDITDYFYTGRATGTVASNERMHALVVAGRRALVEGRCK